MFSYDARASYLHDINPAIKIILILLVTLLVCLSFSLLLPTVTIVTLVLVLRFLGNFTFGEILAKAKLFLSICLSFTVFLLLVKGIDGEGIYRFGIFLWQPADFIYALSLGLRMMVLGLLSLFLVLTTNPNDLVLSLILQFKLSHIHGYATLAAYRFLPTFRQEMDKIKLAQAIRGVETQKGLKARIKAPFQLLIPLLATAVRRGERVALAMESRGLGFSKTRTYYRRTVITRRDILFLISFSLYFIGITLLLIRFHIFNFGLGFSLV